MSNTLKSELPFVACVSAGTLIIHGFSFHAVALCLYFAGTAFFSGPREISLALYLLGGISLLSFGEYASEPLIAAGSLLAVAFSVRPHTRLLYLLALSSLLLSGAINGLLPLTAAVVAASPAGARKWRVSILMAGLVLTLIISGIPTNTERKYYYSDEVLSDNNVIWPQQHELNLTIPEIRFLAPGKTLSDMTLLVNGGGSKRH